MCKTADRTETASAANAVAVAAADLIARLSLKPDQNAHDPDRACFAIGFEQALEPAELQKLLVELNSFISQPSL